jgi:uncharacterized protein YoaH (UPF0181 family)
MTPEQEHQIQNAITRIKELRAHGYSDPNAALTIRMEGYAEAARIEAFRRLKEGKQGEL